MRLKKREIERIGTCLAAGRNSRIVGTSSTYNEVKSLASLDQVTEVYPNRALAIKPTAMMRKGLRSAAEAYAELHDGWV